MHPTSSLPSLQLSNPSHISSAGMHWLPLAHENSVGPHVGAMNNDSKGFNTVIVIRSQMIYI